MSKPDYEEKRRAPRRRVLKQGLAVLHPPSGSIDVCIRDISDTGAKLQLNAEFALDKEFPLVVVAEKLLVQVRLAWQKGRMAGVEFISEPKQIALRKY